MKKNVLIIFFLLTASFANAQTKFCFVDTDYILKHIPEYKAAQLQLDDLSAQWQKEVDAKYVAIEKLYKSYQAEQVLLADDLRKKREDEIVDKEKQVKEFQKIKFGFQGELSKQREELIKPIQDKVFEAVNKYAEQFTYGAIFDKAGDATMLYTNGKLDKSNDIIIALGYKPGDQSGSKPNEKPSEKGKTIDPKKK